jgi:hypothetical protein
LRYYYEPEGHHDDHYESETRYHGYDESEAPNHHSHHEPQAPSYDESRYALIEKSELALLCWQLEVAQRVADGLSSQLEEMRIKGENLLLSSSNMHTAPPNPTPKLSFPVDRAILTPDFKRPPHKRFEAHKQPIDGFLRRRVFTQLGVPAEARLCRDHFGGIPKNVRYEPKEALKTGCYSEKCYFQHEPMHWPDWCIDLIPEQAFEQLLKTEYQIRTNTNRKLFHLEEILILLKQHKTKIKGIAHVMEIIPSTISGAITPAINAATSKPQPNATGSKELMPKRQYKFVGWKEPLPSDVVFHENRLEETAKIIRRIWTAVPPLKPDSEEFKAADKAANDLLAQGKDLGYLWRVIAATIFNELQKERAEAIAKKGSAATKGATTASAVNTAQAETPTPITAQAETPTPITAHAETPTSNTAQAETPTPNTAQAETPTPNSAKAETRAPDTAKADAQPEEKAATQSEGEITPE